MQEETVSLKDKFLGGIKSIKEKLFDQGERYEESMEENMNDDLEYMDSRDYDYGNEEYMVEEEYRAPKQNVKIYQPELGKKNKIQLVKPRSVNSGEDIVMLLKNNTSVVMNFDLLNKEDCRSILDYVSGAACALDGNLEKINNVTFLVAPHNVEIMGESMTKGFSANIKTPWSSEM